MAGNDRTQYTQLHEGTQPGVMDTGISFGRELYITDYARLPRCPPFVANLSGIATSIQEETVSNDGVPMRAFKLHDKTGKYVACTAFGRHTDNPCLVNGNEIIIYFATARPGLQGETGKLWLFETSHVVKLRSQCVAVPARTQLELRAAA